MQITEILLIVLGLVIFIASFLIPEKYDKKSSVDTKEEEKRLRQYLEEEVKRLEFTFEEKVEETVSAVTDKAERQMERVSNEKMMAINEYSDSVLDMIHRNHEEAVFLYDMLNNKHTQLKKTTSELNSSLETAMRHTEQIQTPPAAPPPAPLPSRETKKTAEQAFAQIPDLQKEEPAAQAEEDFSPLAVEGMKVDFLLPDDEDLPARKKPKPKKAVPKKNAGSQAAEEDLRQMSRQTDTVSGGPANHNDRILQMYKDGKTVLGIAKELGLGIGEVKLVIDLFEGA
ncbi:MAG: hypothetical protein IJC59_05870 [Lachnospiraceae bacterium]|nr:hypothetical protein [Lachnospiraceae bacterium]